MFCIGLAPLPVLAVLWQVPAMHPANATLSNCVSEEAGNTMTTSATRPHALA